MPLFIMESDIATRAQILTLKEHTGYKNSQIEAITGVSARNIQRIVAEAYDRGYKEGNKVLNSHVDSKPRSGRPTKINDQTTNAVLNHIRASRATRSHNLVQIAERSNSGIKKDTALKILKRAGMHKVKRTTKPGLTPTIKQQRLAFALKHKDWTLEDWKRVCFSDETSVVLGHRRGADKVWRPKDEAQDQTVSRSRWKGYSEFMFWGCFSYNFKGPYHCWTKETATERKKAQKELDRLNNEREADCKAA